MVDNVDRFRAFSEMTDRMMVAHELQGKPMSGLAILVKRDLNSMLARIEELKTSGKYDEYKMDIDNYQKYSKTKAAQRGNCYDGSSIHVESF